LGTETDPNQPALPTWPLDAMTKLVTHWMVASAFVLCFVSVSATAAGPTLSRFVRESVAANAGVLAAEAALRGLRAREAGAERSYDNPELSVETEEVGAFGTSRENDSKERRYVVGVTQRLDLYGKRRARAGIAMEHRLAAEAGLEDARAAAAGELLNALARHQTAEAQLKLLLQHERTMGDFEMLSERRRAAGDSSGMDAGIATLALAETRMWRAAVEAERAAARQAVLGVTFASDERTWPTLDFHPPALEDAAVETVAALPAVRAARRRADAAAGVVRTEQRARLPDPVVGAGVGRESGVGLVELSVSVPLPVLNRNAYIVPAAEADEMALRREADDVTHRARARFQASAERYRIARRAWGDWQAGGSATLDAREALARRSWDAGELSPAEYLVHVDAVVGLRVRALDLRRTVWEAWFEWLLASGGLEEWLGGGDAK